MASPIQIRNRWEPFFNVNTLAQYSFDLQLVTLDDIDKTTIIALNNNEEGARNKTLPLAAHEYTHWLDHVSTLWGRKLLGTYYSGLVARENNDPHNFYKVVYAHQHIQRTSSNRYYFTKGPKYGEGSPWNSQLTLGSRFDFSGSLDHKNPIPFIRFFKGPTDNEDSLIARMPIAPAALAEVRAMWSEFLWLQQECSGENKNAALVNLSEFKRNYNSQFHDSDFLVYVTSLHLLANHCGSPDLFSIFPYSSALSGLALNFPSSLIPHIKIPPIWENWRQNEWGVDRLQASLDNHDPGFIYAILCCHTQTPVGQDVTQWINTVLISAMDLDLKVVTQEWVKEFDEETSRILKQVSHPIFSKLIEVGGQWREKVGLLGKLDPIVDAVNGKSELPLPDAITGDLVPWNPGDSLSHIDGRSTIERKDYLFEMRNKMDEFLDICGI